MKKYLITSLLILAIHVPAYGEISDDFEDGTIDPTLWVVGGGARSWWAGDPIGTGPWLYSHDEVVAADGYLSARVWGPTSANSYGAEAWMRTVYNFNDGKDHLVNFSWEAKPIIEGHYDWCFIQITDGYIPPLGDLEWPRRRPPAPPITEADLAGTADFLVHDILNPEPSVWPGWSLSTGYGPVSMSIKIYSSGMAQLYDGPDGSGSLINEVYLDITKAWYIRFMVMDGTSAGFPAGDTHLNLYHFSASVTPMPICVDIKPGSCPNPLNVKSQGVLPVAVLGTEVLDVIDIDVATVSLAGVAPIRFDYEDVATPFEGELCDCHEDGPDGYFDLTLKFDTQEIVTALGYVEDGEYLPLTLSVTLVDGTVIEGSDCIRIIKKGKD